MNFDADLVYALRQVANLGWGAIDFGPAASGDIMHFDLRTLGIGREINTRKAVPGADPVALHPYLRSTTEAYAKETVEDHAYDEMAEWDTEHEEEQEADEGYGPEEEAYDYDA